MIEIVRERERPLVWNYGVAVQITARGTPGQGSTFLVQLPVSQATEPAEAPAEIHRPG